MELETVVNDITLELMTFLMTPVIDAPQCNRLRILMMDPWLISHGYGYWVPLQSLFPAFLLMPRRMSSVTPHLNFSINGELDSPFIEQ